MIRTGEEYRQSLADGREVWIDGEQVKNVTTHPAFKPIIDVRARIYDLAHEPGRRKPPTSSAPSTLRPPRATRSQEKNDKEE